MKSLRTCLWAILMMLAGDALSLAQAPPSSTTQPPATPGASPSAATPSTGAQTAQATPPSAAAPAGNPAAPPSAAPQKSDADLDKLVAPIAIYPDPLLATVLPASAYPLEIVQAARFVKDTNNIAKLDSQPWDDNVKAVARFPQVINQMSDNIQWTSDLGDAFINQPKGVTDAIQRMRVKAEGSGALKTTEQQVVTVTNTVVTNIVEQVPVYVTNQVVQIQPAQPDVVYVPQYNPTVVYGGYPAVYPGYAYPPYYPVAGAAVSFGLGMAAGAIIANNCDWGHGGCWGGSYHSDVNVNRNVNINDSFNRNANVNRSGTANVNRGGQQKWQADSNRLKNSGSSLSSAQSREARGYGSGSTRTGSTAASQRASAAQNLSASERSTPNRSGAGTANRSGSTTPRSSGGSGLSPTGPSGNRPSSPGANRPSSSQGANRPTSSQGANRPSSSSQSFNRPSSSGSGSSRSAFSGGGGGGGASTRAASSRGSASRGGGGGRGGGGRR